MKHTQLDHANCNYRDVLPLLQLIFCSTRANITRDNIIMLIKLLAFIAVVTE